MTPIEALTELWTDMDLAEAKVPGGYVFSGGGYPYSPPASSKQAWDPLKTLNCAPPQTIQIARFPKDKIEPSIVERQMVDATPDRHWDGSKLNRIPDFGKDWEDKERRKIERKADRYFVAPEDIPEVPQLHGWYVVFSLHESRYDSNTHVLFRGIGRHIHEDFFIAKIGQKPDANGRTSYTDIPKEFLSVRTKIGWRLYATPLAEHGKSMLTSLVA